MLSLVERNAYRCYGIIIEERNNLDIDLYSLDFLAEHPKIMRSAFIIRERTLRIIFDLKGVEHVKHILCGEAR